VKNARKSLQKICKGLLMKKPSKRSPATKRKAPCRPTSLKELEANSERLSKGIIKAMIKNLNAAAKASA
jgi:hypothetical protein